MFGRGYDLGLKAPVRSREEDKVIRKLNNLKPLMVERLRFLKETKREGEFKKQVGRLGFILSILDNFDYYYDRRRLFSLPQLSSYIDEVESIKYGYPRQPVWTPEEPPIPVPQSILKSDGKLADERDLNDEFNLTNVKMPSKSTKSMPVAKNWFFKLWESDDEPDTFTQVNDARPVPAPSELLATATSNSGERSSTNARAGAIGDVTALSIDVTLPSPSSTPRSSSAGLSLRSSTPSIAATTEATESFTPPVVPTCTTLTTSSLHKPRHQHQYKVSRIPRLIPRSKLLDLQGIKRPAPSIFPPTTTSDSGKSSSSDAAARAMEDFTPPTIDVAAEEHDDLDTGTPSCSTVPMNTDCEMERQNGIINLETSGGQITGQESRISPRQEQLAMKSAETFEAPQPSLTQHETEVEESSTWSGTNASDMRANSDSNDKVEKAKGSRSGATSQGSHKKKQNISSDHVLTRKQTRKRAAGISAVTSGVDNNNMVSKQKEKIYPTRSKTQKK